MSANWKKLLQGFFYKAMIVTGFVLLFCGFFTEPKGEIHPSVLIAYGETLTFAGTAMGIDYKHRYKNSDNDGNEPNT